jgi:ribosomal protein S18 acetylase RimI-like enzyme
MSQNSFRLRPAKPADHPRLRSLDARLIGEAELPGATPAHFVRFQAAFTDRALADPAGTIIVAVDSADAILGYVHLMETEDDVLGRALGYVSIIAVAEAAGGKGIGRALMAAAEAWARERGYPALVLDVFASNDTARRFYAAQGFAEDSLRLRKVLS